MEASRKGLAKVEGRRRIGPSGLTIAWRGTPSLDDWVAYIANGAKTDRIILAEGTSERKVFSRSCASIASIGSMVPCLSATVEGESPPATSWSLVLTGRTTCGTSRARDTARAGGQKPWIAPLTAMHSTSLTKLSIIRHLRARERVAPGTPWGLAEPRPARLVGQTMCCAGA